MTQEEQKVQELLKPRYKVIADYPGSIFKVGEVFYSLSGKIYCDPDSVKFADFPHLFRKLEWWEERKPEEMPEYVKWDDVSKYFPVERVCKASEAPFGANYATRIEPATSAEYTAYIEKQPTTQNQGV